MPSTPHLERWGVAVPSRQRLGRCVPGIPPVAVEQRKTSIVGVGVAPRVARVILQTGVAVGVRDDRVDPVRRARVHAGVVGVERPRPVRPYRVVLSLRRVTALRDLPAGPLVAHAAVLRAVQQADELWLVDRGTRRRIPVQAIPIDLVVQHVRGPFVSLAPFEPREFRDLVPPPVLGVLRLPVQLGLEVPPAASCLPRVRADVLGVVGPRVMRDDRAVVQAGLRVAAAVEVPDYNISGVILDGRRSLLVLLVTTTLAFGRPVRAAVEQHVARLGLGAAGEIWTAGLGGRV